MPPIFQKNVMGAIDAAASTAKVLTVSPDVPCFIGAVSLSTAQRGRVTRLNISGVDLMGTNASFPMIALQRQSGLWECNFAGAPCYPGTASFSMACTLDANGQTSVRLYVDPIPPTLQAKIEASPNACPIDQNFLLGLGEVTVPAATAGVLLTTTLKRDVRGWFRLVIDTATVPAINDITFSSLQIAGNEQNNQTASPISVLDFHADNTGKLGGMFYIEGKAGSPLTIILNNNSAGGIVVSAGFIRCYPGSGWTAQS